MFNVGFGQSRFVLIPFHNRIFVDIIVWLQDKPFIWLNPVHYTHTAFVKQGLCQDSEAATTNNDAIGTYIAISL